MNAKQWLCDLLMEGIVRTLFALWYCVAVIWGYCLYPVIQAWREVFTLDFPDYGYDMPLSTDATKYNGWNSGWASQQREKQRKMDYALLWAHLKSQQDHVKRYVYESVKGPAVNLQRMPETNMFWTDGTQMGFWPAGWDEGFRDFGLEKRLVEEGPKLQFNGQHKHEPVETNEPATA